MIASNPRKYHRQTCWYYLVDGSYRRKWAERFLQLYLKLRRCPKKNNITAGRRRLNNDSSHGVSPFLENPQVERNLHQRNKRDKDNNNNGGASAEPLFETKPSRSIIQLAEKHLQSFSCPARSETVIKGDHTDWFLSTLGTAY